MVVEVLYLSDGEERLATRIRILALGEVMHDIESSVLLAGVGATGSRDAIVPLGDNPAPATRIDEVHQL